MINVNKKEFMKLGDIISIIPSGDLNDMKLNGLCGKTGKVSDKVYSNKSGLIGYWATLDSPFKGELEWFVPTSSIVW